MVTPLGWGMAAASVVLYGIGAWLGYPEPVVLAVGGAVAVVTAVVWVLPRPRLVVTREVSPLRVSRGDPAFGVLHVTNAGRTRRSGLRAHDVSGDSEIDVEVPKLRPGATGTIDYRLPTDRRGEIPVGPLRLVRADPLGLVRRTREYGGRAVLLVRPKTVRLPLLPSGRAHHLEGPTTDTAPAGTVTFHALREYVVGDDLRHVHWRSSARTGTLMVRQLVDASLPQTTIVVDSAQEAYRAVDDFELAVDAAASVAVGAASQSFPVRILTGQGSLSETRGGPHDIDTVLDRLAGVVPRESPHTALDIARRVRGGGSLVVVTGSDAGLAGIASLRRRFDRVVCLRIRPPGPAPGVPGVGVIDVHELDDLTVGWRGVAR